MAILPRMEPWRPDRVAEPEPPRDYGVVPAAPVPDLVAIDPERQVRQLLEANARQVARIEQLEQALAQQRRIVAGYGVRFAASRREGEGG